MADMSAFVDSIRSKPVTVEGPHVYDAIGSTLRNAYMRDRSLPDDMARALENLDRATRAGTARHS